MAQNPEVKTEVTIPASLGLSDTDKEDLKKQFTAALQGVLDQHAATRGKHVRPSLFWKAAND